MELLLNVVWLVVVCGLLRLALHRGSFRADRKAWLALALVAMMLFPVISISDDIHECIFVAETRSFFETSISNVAAHWQLAAVSVAILIAMDARELVALESLNDTFSARQSAELLPLPVLKRPPPAMLFS